MESEFNESLWAGKPTTHMPQAYVRSSLWAEPLKPNPPAAKETKVLLPGIKRVFGQWNESSEMGFEKNSKSRLRNTTTAGVWKGPEVGSQGLCLDWACASFVRFQSDVYTAGLYKQQQSHEEGSCKKKQQKEVNVNEPSKDAANNKKTHYVPKKTIPTTTGVTNGDAVGSPPSIPPVALEFTTGFVEVTQPNSKESLPAFGNDVDKSVTMPCNNETLSRMNVLNGVVVDTPPDNNVDNSEIPLSHQHEDNEDDVVSVGTLEDEKGCDPPFEAVLTKSQKKRAREKAKKAVMAESQSKSWNMRPRSANLPGPWCIIGDFNAVMGAHEKSSVPPPTKASCDDFLAFSETNDLHYLDTRGASYTWTSTRKGRHHTELRLERVICNKQWILSWDSSSAWLNHSGLRDVVLNAWQQQFFGCPMYVLIQKMKFLKSVLKTWNKERIADEGHSDELHFVEVEASNKLVDALKIQKDFWRSKSRLNWVKGSDACTKFFHTYAEIRAATNKLTHLKADGDILVSHDENIQKSVSQDDNNYLTAMPDMFEIKVVVDDMNANGSPGSDGFSGIFFTSFWDIIGTDVINSVQCFFQNGWLIPNANPSLVIIIPKEPGADVIENFRPISLGNLHFKIIVKILANHLSPIASRIISPQQRAFLKDKSIFNCIGITSEAINVLDYKTFGGNLSLKFYIRKAFDTLNWEFLLQSKAMGYFGCTRGVHQGDPLSPILFCLAKDVLSSTISNAFEKGTKRDVQALMNIFEEYGHNSGQFISAAKCTIYSSKPKNSHLNKIMDIIKLKFTAWKGKSLSMMGRVELVQTVIARFGLYSFHVYKWPISCIKTLEKWIRNFVWSGDINTTHHNSVALDKVCLPENEGGLGIKSMKSLNDAALMKIIWKTMTENSVFEYLELDNSNLHNSVAEFIIEVGWYLPSYMPELEGHVQQLIRETPFASHKKDKQVWIASKPGCVTMKDAYDYHRPRATKNMDFRDLWDIKVPLRRACIAWKIMRNRIATDDNVKTQGVDAANCCNLCVQTSAGLFEHRLISSNQAITHVKNLIVESSRHSGGFSFNTSADKIILDFLGIKSLPPKMPKVISVKWQSPLPGWIKSNIDGFSIGNPGLSGCGWFFATLMAIKNPDLVPWTLSTHWINCLKFASSIQFVCTHIYREGNSVEDLLSKHGALVESRWWIEPPYFTRRKLLIDNSILPLYRFRIGFESKGKKKRTLVDVDDIKYQNPKDYSDVSCYYAYTHQNVENDEMVSAEVVHDFLKYFEEEKLQLVDTMKGLDVLKKTKLNGTTKMKEFSSDQCLDISAGYNHTYIFTINPVMQFYKW
ncbi:hypothetical protein C5167_014343 [Papaver somniferum]|uniref:Reverse transcriptase domain-containing protein n=1 Tax=Papaver somniferum TaxID=3469 RepID=A0A4Y7J600_PAPSO|nr:hypothetical protein C5167_014343 [Papaver somniferum]